MQFQLIQIFDRNVDSLLVPDDIEEVVVNRVAHIVLRNLVRPNIDDVVLPNDANDRPGDVRGILFPGATVPHRLENRLDNAEDRLRVLIAFDAFRNLPAVILTRHPAGQIRTHVKQLASKTYWDGLTVTPDFVVMFVPGDNFYAAAVERDPALFEDAAAQRVIIVTPATLIALAKAVAFGWRQEKVAENAQHVHALGRELYRRMITMTSHIGRCGDALGKSVKHFNQFIGSLEQSVMPQVRRFNELEVEGTATEVPVLEPIELEPRLLRSDRDFVEGEPRSPAASLLGAS